MTLSTRFELAARMAPKKPCRKCGATAPPAIGRSGLCYECETGHRTEVHHVRGRPHSPTIAVPGNIHRQLSARAECRRPVLKQPSDNPLIESARIATIIAELIETGADYVRRQTLPEWLAKLADIAAKLCRRTADNLLIAAARIEKEAGPDWYQGAEFLPWE